MFRNIDGREKQVSNEEEEEILAEWAANEVAHQVTRQAVRLEKIKTECSRRITQLCPEWKQRNLLAQAVLLQDKGRANWTDEDRAAWQSGRMMWGRIAALRARSDVLEENPPEDPTEDAHWA